MQETKLYDYKEQEKENQKIGNKKILSFLQKARSPQRKIAVMSIG
jgi:hypothetical protein